MDTVDNFDENVLQHLLNKYSSDEYSCEPSPKRNKPVNSVDEKLLQLIQHQLTNQLSLKSTTDTAKLMNSMPGAEFSLPETREQIKNRIQPQHSYDYLVICECKSLVKDGDVCEKCNIHAKKNSKKNNFIVSFDIIKQIKSILAQKYVQILEYLNRNHDEGILSDVDDGIAFKMIQEKYPHSKLLSFTMNIDGAAIHRSSKCSLWITQIYQNYLPPEIRFRPENILVVSLYYAAKKPDPILLLAHFAKGLHQADFSVFDGNQLIHFVPTVVVAAADLPARAMLQNMKGHNGKSSCSVCHHPGVGVKNPKKTTTIRYLKGHSAILRTHNDTVNKARAVSNGAEAIDGIKGPSCMLLFDYFNVAENYSIDFMHGVALGITKDVIEIWIGVKKIPHPGHDIKFKMKSLNERKTFEKRILQLKPLMHFRRKPRSIFEVANFKATELVNFLLYYSRFAVINLLPDRIIKHFEQLSAATFILCKRSLSNDDIMQASEMLSRFADNFEEIYGRNSITMNVHLLRHYGHMCRLCGPLWANSLFGFESNIGAVKKLVCGTTDVLVQIAEKYALSKTFGDNINTNNIVTDENVYQPKKIIIDKKYEQILSRYGIKLQENDQLTVYRRSKGRDGHTYSSKIAAASKSADYFLKMKDNVMGTAEFFLKINGQNLVLLNDYEIDYQHYHLAEVKQLKSNSIHPCENIEKKLLFLSCSGIEYISEELPAYFFMS